MADNFGVDASTITAENISSTTSKEMRHGCMLLRLSVATYLYADLYLADDLEIMRLCFGSAVLALIHDVLVVLAFYAVARVYRWVSTFIACMLTIVGYSINATIVIFDRIREQLMTGREEECRSSQEVVNRQYHTDADEEYLYITDDLYHGMLYCYILGRFVRCVILQLPTDGRHRLAGAYSSVCITGSLWYAIEGHVSEKSRQ